MRPKYILTRNKTIWRLILSFFSSFICFITIPKLYALWNWDGISFSIPYHILPLWICMRSVFCSPNLQKFHQDGNANDADTSNGHKNKSSLLGMYSMSNATNRIYFLWQKRTFFHLKYSITQTKKFSTASLKISVGQLRTMTMPTYVFHLDEKKCKKKSTERRKSKKNEHIEWKR